jgi:hypothetical protein
VPFVVRDVFGEPEAVEPALDELCRSALGSRIADGEFFEASVGAVAGVVLEDGRRVVVKAHPPGASTGFLTAMQTVQRRLVESGYPCPEPLASPTPVAAGLAVVETLIDRGVSPNGHDPLVRKALAGALWELIERCRPLAQLDGLDEHAMTVPEGELWPTPHDRRFDFEGTSAGAEWIDSLARQARQIRDEEALDVVVAHSDWRVEHVRMEGGVLTAVYDWDSVMLMTEPQAVGSGAHAFTMNWATGDTVMPSLEELRAFVTDYEEARGRAFSDGERRSAFGSLVYSLAYNARCGHSDKLTDFGRKPPRPELGRPPFSPGGTRALLAAHGEELLT